MNRLTFSLETAALAALLLLGQPGWMTAQSFAAGTNPAPDIVGLSKPQAGDTHIIFHGKTGPFRVQTRNTLDATAPWFDVVDAKVYEAQTGVFVAQFPMGKEDIAFYRIVNETETIALLKGWTYLVQVSTPANRQFFVKGESPVLTVTILDNFAQGINREALSTLNLYLQGPRNPQFTVTASKLLNASTDRSKQPHHYINLKTSLDATVKDNILTYTLKPITDEAPGTYTATIWAALGSDTVQQMMKYVDFQIGSGTVEPEVVTAQSCAACHLGPVSGRMYMHHIDPGYSPTGNWALDFAPVRSCAACHNNDGYAAYTDPAAPGGRVPDPTVRRVHGVHMGEHLKNDFNTNASTGDFKDYTHVLFPADARNCKTCHQDNDLWKTQPYIMACGSCHDNVWFGPMASKPTHMVIHSAGPREDGSCARCHTPEIIAEYHQIPPPNMDAIDVAMTPPANGKFYVAGEKPVITMVFKDDSGKPIDHTLVTDGNFSTASLFVYGPRSRAMPVLTSAAKNVNSKLRASVTSSKAGPWPINGKIFKIAVNYSAPQEIVIKGASNLVTAAEVVASLNGVLTNLGGAKATVSGANVNIRTTIQGENARFEIYNGEVTTAMGWKRGPNTIMEPDVTIAAGTTPSNDIRALSDPLDYQDPLVTRTAASVSYQLDDVAGLSPGTYAIYVYHLPRADKIPGMKAPTGVGHLKFQVGTQTMEKKVATNCADCHADTIFHLTSGPIHAEPFDTDYCNACHDYGKTTMGEMFKNQGGTSLSGWSGYGAVPISRRTHGVHFAHYLDHSEEIYANATKETFGGIIFPMDVRNCTKCHAESNSWKEKPSRLACLGCHDTDAAKAHAKLTTYIPDPADPYGPLAVETCVICHGPGSELSPDKVHDIASPYVPPYPREAE